jgi:fructokinase
VWDLEARYLAQAVRAVTYMVAPQRVIFGGGVILQPGLVDRIAAHLPRSLGGYTAAASQRTEGSGYVVAAALGGDAGLLGALALGMDVTRPR